MSMQTLAADAAGLFVAGVVKDPKAKAPEDLKDVVNTTLSVVKWISIMCLFGLLLSAGAVALAGDRGHGQGLSPEMKGLVGRAVVGLIIVSSASQIVNFVLA